MHACQVFASCLSLTGKVVQNVVYIDRPQQVIVGNENVVGLPTAGKRKRLAVTALCNRGILVVTIYCG